MYKLTVVSGKNRGATFALNDGKNTVGRQNGNVVVLRSSKVSRTHCVLTVNGEEVYLEDNGSANGTFLNGNLVREKPVGAGDRISVGDYVLEVSKIKARKADHAPAVGGDFGNVVMLDMPPGLQQAQNQGAVEGLDVNAQAGSDAPLEDFQPNEPKDFKEKAIFYFEKHVMPVFYGMNLKYEWKFIAVGMFAVYVLLTLLLTVAPQVEVSRQSVILEAARRARFLAKEIAERNAAYIAKGLETKTSTFGYEREFGVRLAYLIDLDNRIIAPSGQVNQYLASGSEAVFARKVAEYFQKSQERSYTKVLEGGNLIVSLRALEIYDPRKAKNVVAAMSIVSIDTTYSTLDVGSIGLMYSEAMIWAAILGALLMFIMYRLTLKPFEVLNEDIDKVLKGDLSEVSHSFHAEEFDQLWDVINSSLQRIPRDSESGMGGDEFGGGGGIQTDDFVMGIQSLFSNSDEGICVCDGPRNVQFLNETFEDVTGIRSDEAMGGPLTAAARDQSFIALLEDLFQQAEGSFGNPVSDSTDFSGVEHEVSIIAFGSGSPKAYVLTLKKKEEDEY